MGIAGTAAAIMAGRSAEIMRRRSRAWILIRPHRGWAYRIESLTFSALPSLCPVLAVCVAFGATACDRHVYLGGSLGDAGNTDAGTGILWRALFESGDLSEWTG